jgi:DNA mismatch repair protein MutS
VKNLNVAVREWQDEVVFLHKILAGAADKSYGIHVARLAGVPKAVVERAKEILFQLEEEHHDPEGGAKIARRPEGTRPRSGVQLTLFAPIDHPILDDLRQVDLDGTTPLAALGLLKAWQERLAAETKRKGGRRRPE